MKSELRVLVLTLVILVVDPILYGLGDWLGGLPVAIALPTAATLASWLYARRGEPRGPSPRPPAAPPASPVHP